MRVAFDLDDTLIPGDPTACPCEPPVPWALRPWFPERIRRGTWALLRDLRARGCEVWVYTTSGRDAGHLRLWFLLQGVWLGGVVNCRRHEDLMRTRRHPTCSKYPPAYGIDLLIDDSDGVALEGKRHGFAVLVVAPDDPDWADRVRSVVSARLPVRSPRRPAR